jgi:hypothetical protein
LDDKKWEDILPAMILLFIAASAHHFHAYILSIPIAIFVCIQLGIILKREIGL